MFNLTILLKNLMDGILIFNSNNQLQIYSANRYDLDALEAGYLKSESYQHSKNHNLVIQNYDMNSLEEGYKIYIEDV